jgi:hypothetical protein
MNKLVDPWRKPGSGKDALQSDFASLTDKLRIARLRGLLRNYSAAIASLRPSLNSCPVPFEPPERPIRIRPGIYVCSDHRGNASINGALASGTRAAKVVYSDLPR